MNRLITLTLACVFIAILGTFMTNTYPQKYESARFGAEGQFITGNLDIYVESEELKTFYKLEEDAYKYVNIVREDYNYNISNLNTYLTTKELKKVGGVCWHYAKWHIQMAQEDGYIAKPIRINIGVSNLHEVAIISSKAGYCILDQIDVVGCWEASQDEE